MQNSLQSLKSLEGLVKQAADALQRVSAEKRALQDKLARLESQNKGLKEQLREAKLALTRHERLKSRLVKLSEKLERIA